MRKKIGKKRNKRSYLKGLKKRKLNNKGGIRL